MPRPIMLSATNDSSSHSDRFAAYWRTRTTTPNRTTNQSSLGDTRTDSIRIQMERDGVAGGVRGCREATPVEVEVKVGRARR